MNKHIKKIYILISKMNNKIFNNIKNIKVKPKKAFF